MIKDYRYRNITKSIIATLMFSLSNNTMLAMDIPTPSIVENHSSETSTPLSSNNPLQEILEKRSSKPEKNKLSKRNNRKQNKIATVEDFAQITTEDFTKINTTISTLESEIDNIIKYIQKLQNLNKKKYNNYETLYQDVKLKKEVLQIHRGMLTETKTNLTLGIKKTLKKIDNSNSQDIVHLNNFVKTNIDDNCNDLYISIDAILNQHEEFLSYTTKLLDKTSDDLYNSDKITVTGINHINKNLETYKKTIEKLKNDFSEGIEKVSDKVNNETRTIKNENTRLKNQLENQKQFYEEKIKELQLENQKQSYEEKIKELQLEKIKLENKLNQEKILNTTNEQLINDKLEKINLITKENKELQNKINNLEENNTKQMDLLKIENKQLKELQESSTELHNSIIDENEKLQNKLNNLTEKNTKQMDLLTKENKQLKDKLNELQKFNPELHNSIIDENEELKNKLKISYSQYAKLQTKNKNLNSKINILNKMLNKKRIEIDQSKDLQLINLGKQIKELKQKLDDVQKNNKDLIQNESQLRQELEEKNLQIQQMQQMQQIQYNYNRIYSLAVQIENNSFYARFYQNNYFFIEEIPFYLYIKKLDEEGNICPEKRENVLYKRSDNTLYFPKEPDSEDKVYDADIRYTKPDPKIFDIYGYQDVSSEIENNNYLAQQTILNDQESLINELTKKSKNYALIALAWKNAKENNPDKDFIQFIAMMNNPATKQLEEYYLLYDIRSNHLELYVK